MNNSITVVSHNSGSESKQWITQTSVSPMNPSVGSMVTQPSVPGVKESIPPWSPHGVAETILYSGSNCNSAASKHSMIGSLGGTTNWMVSGGGGVTTKMMVVSHKSGNNSSQWITQSSSIPANPPGVSKLTHSSVPDAL